MSQFVLLLLVSLPAAWFDIRYFRIPDVLTLGGSAAALSIAAVLSLRYASWNPILSAGLGLVIGFGLFVAVSVGMPGKLGFGDVKYAAFIGACIGAPLWFAAVFVAAMTGIVTAVGVVGAHRFRFRAGSESATEGPNGRIPFAPFLAGGAVSASVAAWLLPALQEALS